MALRWRSAVRCDCDSRIGTFTQKHLHASQAARHQLRFEELSDSVRRIALKSFALRTEFAPNE